jgi:hypothetical protein
MAVESRTMAVAQQERQVLRSTCHRQFWKKSKDLSPCRLTAMHCVICLYEIRGCPVRFRSVAERHFSDVRRNVACHDPDPVDFSDRPRYLPASRASSKRFGRPCSASAGSAPWRCRDVCHRHSFRSVSPSDVILHLGSASGAFTAWMLVLVLQAYLSLRTTFLRPIVR